MHLRSAIVLPTSLTYIFCLYASTVSYSLFQANCPVIIIRIEPCGDNMTDVEGLGFDSDDEATIREAGIGAVGHVEIGHLFSQRCRSKLMRRLAMTRLRGALREP